MNRVFRIIWNRALNQFVVASELCRSFGKGARSAGGTAPSLSAMGRMALAVSVALVGAPAAMAHTTSIGFANAGQNALTFYYGTYHSGSETTYNEGSLLLVNNTTGVSTTVGFNILTGTKPTGLVDGDTNFYSDGTKLVGTQNQNILNWQGVTFTNLAAGDYTFTYIPITNPTQVWEPIDSVILSSTVHVITADLSTAHHISAGEVVDQTYSTDPMIMDGGKEQSTADGELSQTVSITRLGGTFDTHGHDLELSGNMDGRGTLTKDGQGTLTLSGQNISLGGTTVDEGTLTTTGTGSLGTGRLTVADGADVDLHNAAQTVAGVDGQGDISLDGTTLTLNGDTSASYSGTISGNGSLVKDGTYTQVLSGSNTYNGTTTVNNGNLSVATGGSLGDGRLTVQQPGSVGLANGAQTVEGIDGNGGIALSNTILTLDGTSNAAFDGTVSGTGGLVKNGGYTQVLTGNNTFTGGTTINDGVLAVSSDANLGATTGGITLNGGILESTGTFTSGRNVTVDSNGGALATDAGSTLTLTGLVAGAGALTKSGTGTLVVNGSLSQAGGLDVAGGTVVLSGNNSYSGGTTVNAGELQVANDANLGQAGDTLALNGGVLHVTDNVDTARNLVLGGGSISVDGNTTLASTAGTAGSGALVKNGQGTLSIAGTASHAGGTTVNEGTLILSGNNTYMGGTTVNGGELQVASDASLGHAGDPLALNGGVLHTTGHVVTARNLVLAGGSISVDGNTTLASTAGTTGAGPLVKNGEGTLSIAGLASHAGGATVNDGTLILSGNNTYTGGTTLNGGELQVSADRNLGAAANGITFNGGTLHATATFDTARDLVVQQTASVTTDAGTTVTSSGTVAGHGGLVKNGAGTLALAGVASQAGGTTVNDGTLVLSGQNTYTGGTQLNGGTLSIAADANLGDAANIVTFHGGTLATTANFATQRTMVLTDAGGTIDTAGGTTLSQQGSITGTGSLVKLGGGTLVVSGANTFTGGTLIDGGTIRIDSGSSLGTGDIVLRGGILQTYATLGTGQQVLVSGNSGVNVSAGTTTVLSGNINTDGASGCFIKSGAGALSLTGHASLDQGTCVQNGTLRANGTLDSAFVAVDSIGVLRGVGTINGPVSVSGRLAPGNSPGTLVVNGTVTMNASSTFEADIDGTGTGTGRGNYSRLLVVGAGHQFVANGTLEPLLRGITGDASNTYVPRLGDNYRIVTAEGGIVGRFTSLTQPAGGLPSNTRFIALYNLAGSNSIDLRVVPTAYGELLGAGARRNVLSAANALDRAVDAQVAGSGDAYAGIMNTIGSLDVSQIPTALKAMAGEVHADQAASARGMGLALNRDAVDHLSTDSVDAAHRVWANLTQDGQRSVADGQGSGFNTSTSHVTAGVDLLATDDTVLGVGASHGESNIIASGGQGTIRSNAGLVYAQQKAGRVILDGVLAYGSDDWSTRRADPLGGGSVESRSDGHDTTASLTARLPLDTSASRIEPYVSVVWQKVERDALQETGASAAALSVDALSKTGVRSMLGVAASSKNNDPLASELTWRVGVAAGVDSGSLLDPEVRAHLAGQSFETRAPGAGRGFVQVNASGTMRLSHNTYLYGGLNAEQGSGRSAYGATAGVRVTF